MTAKFACSAALAALFVASPALSSAWAQGGGASQTQEWEALSQRVRPAEREWDVRAGVAGVMRPTFEGSDNYATALSLVGYCF